MKINLGLTTEEYEKIRRLTLSDYTGDLSYEEVVSLVEDLLNNIENLEEKIERLENTEVESKDPYTLYGINERDFY